MSCVVKSYNKRTGVTYAYSSVAVWDPEAGYSKPIRKCIGKIDPETGNIVPTGKRGRPRKSQTLEKKEEKDSEPIDDVADLQEALRRSEEKRHEDEATIKTLQAQADCRISQIKLTIDALKKLESSVAQVRIAYEDMLK